MPIVKHLLWAQYLTSYLLLILPPILDVRYGFLHFTDKLTHWPKVTDLTTRGGRILIHIFLSLLCHVALGIIGSLSLANYSHTIVLTLNR